jgi:twinkle protein
MPLEGIYLPQDYDSPVLDLYKNGTVSGVSTGIESIDPYYTVMPSQLTVVTGFPGSGKSELVDQFCLNIAMSKGWRFAVASFENPPHMHIAKLAEKVVGKPFFHTDGRERMSEEERDYALDFLNNHFVFLQTHDGSSPTVQSIIERTKQAIMRLGVRGLIIDPYNYLDIGDSENETKSISKMLTEIVMFCQSHGVHCFFIAHPKHGVPDNVVPTGRHISGSAAWFAKADMGITAHRNGNKTEFHVWKVRFKWCGKTGMTHLNYDLPTGRYSDAVVEEDDGFDWDFPLDE